MTRFDLTDSNFDQWLDGHVSGKSTPDDATSNDAPDSHQLRGAASQFHDLAASSDNLTGDPTTNERLDHIWENVMMKTAFASPGPTAGIVSGSTISSFPIGRANPLVSRRRWPVIVNAFVAAALVLGLSFGVWQTYQGLNGGGDDGSGIELSALLQATAESDGTPQVTNQNGTPVGAPVVGSIDMPTTEECTVVPLTVDQVLAAIEQPHADKWSDDPEDFVGSGAEDVSTTYLGPPPEGVFNQVSALQREWSACVLAGSWMRLFALMSPSTIRAIVTDRLYPIYLTEADGRVIIETLEETGLGPHGETAQYVFGEERITLVNPDPTVSRIVGKSYVQPGILVFGLDGEIRQVLDYPGVNQQRTYSYAWNFEQKVWLLSDIQMFAG